MRELQHIFALHPEGVQLWIEVVAAYSPVPRQLPPANPHRNADGTIGEGWIRALLKYPSFTLGGDRRVADAAELLKSCRFRA